MPARPASNHNSAFRTAGPVDLGPEVDALLDASRDLSGDGAGLEIVDDGAGFDLSQAQVGAYGLPAMRERAERPGGALHLRSVPGARTTVRVKGAALTERAETAIRVLLVDDHAVVRKGMRALLDRETGIDVVGEADDGEQAVRAADRLRPDVILMDLEMPGVGGIDATRRISESHPESRIVVLTSHAAEEDVFPALKAGALGYLLKHSAPEDVLQAIRQAHRALLGSFSARTYAMAPEQRIIRSRDGLDLLPRYTFDSVPTLDRVLLPAGENGLAKLEAEAAWSAIEPGRPAVDLYGSVGHGESAYDVSFRDLAETRNRFLAQHVANVLFYPADVAQVPGAAWPIREALAVIGSMLGGAAVVLVATHARLPRRGRLKPIAQPA